MSENKHTKGPWIWGKHGALYAVGTPPYKYGSSILYADDDYDTGLTINISDGDARLIAAAPDLLEALEALFIQALQSDLNSASNEWGREAIDKAFNAISLVKDIRSKAEGRSNG